MSLNRIILFISIFWMGCTFQKLAGTEVGNPEIAVTARFAIEGTGDSMSIMDMNLKCMGMAFHTENDSEGSIWDAPIGIGVNMADTNQNKNTLKPLNLKTGAWASAEMLIKSLVGDSSLPTLSTFEKFGNPRYFKFQKIQSGDTLRFLYEMPEDWQLKMMFSKNKITSWMHKGTTSKIKDTLAIEIMFDGGKWAAGLNKNANSKIRLDGLGREYQLLTPKENSVYFEQLHSMMPRCFLADSIKTY